jgi:hypothetical protein
MLASSIKDGIHRVARLLARILDHHATAHQHKRGLSVKGFQGQTGDLRIVRSDVLYQVCYKRKSLLRTNLEPYIQTGKNVSPLFPSCVVFLGTIVIITVISFCRPAQITQGSDATTA